MKPRTNNMPNRLGLGIAAAAVLTMTFLLPAAGAQIRMSGVAAPNAGIRPTPPASGNGMTRTGISGPGFAGVLSHSHRGHSFGRSGILFPYPYYPSYYDYDEGFDSAPAAQPQVVVVPAATPSPPAPPPPPLEPLLIEWKGDHFERMTLSQKNSGKIEEESGPDYSAKSAVRAVSPESPSSRSPRSARKTAAQGQAQSAPEIPRELPPAVLVFRDGRTEEMRSYIIMNGTIYSKADYWTTGSWNRKIQIADLDVPATLKLNQDHGLNFVLPASPNEVVTRP